MTFSRRRAFHLGGASWLLLCAMGNGAMAQDAATASATQLPEITVTAPSPIVRRNAGAVANTRARRTRGSQRAIASRHRRPQPVPVAAAPQQGVLPIVTDQFATVTVVPNEEIRREGGATLGDLLFSKPGHHRLQLRAGRFKPADHSRSRRQSRRHRRERHRRRRRLRSRRRPFRSDRSAGDQPGRSDPRTRDLALRIDIDRRRRQRDQQPNSGRPARLRGGAVPELRAAGQGAARECAIARLRDR